MFREFNVEYRQIPGTGFGGLGPYWPAYLFARGPLNLPIAMGALGHGGRAHAIDEYCVIKDNNQVYGLAGAEKGYLSVLYEYARMMG